MDEDTAEYSSSTNSCGDSMCCDLLDESCNCYTNFNNDLDYEQQMLQFLNLTSDNSSGNNINENNFDKKNGKLIN